MKEQAYSTIEKILMKYEIEFDDNIREVSTPTLALMLNTLHGEVSSEDMKTINKQFMIIQGQ
jgi:hypothetical protein